MFRRGGRRIPESEEAAAPQPTAAPLGRVTSVLGPEVQFKWRITGRGGIRVEGSFEGEIDFDGLLVVAESGRVTCEEARAKAIVVAGIFKGNIVAERVEIRKTGRVWGDVVTTSFATEEGAFLRGQIRMEERLPAETESPPEAESPPATEAREAAQE
jgi:cytoskeletal protein CcmA (bactofilin family)